MIRNQNFSYEQPKLPKFEEVIDCNFTQRDPYTTIGDGTQQFVECNLLNCDVRGATVKKSLTVQKSFCYWLHKDMGLPVEPVNCPHVVDTDEVYIDGKLVEIVYHREDTLL